MLIPHLISAEVEETLLKFLPNNIPGWGKKESPEIYNRNTLYDYIDGAAEIYLAYDFQNLLVQRYTKSKNSDIIVEIFDMGSPEDAFGIFSHSQGRVKKDAGIGQDGEYRHGLLCFWKNRFFICILAEGTTPSTKKDILSIGRAISKSIKTNGEKPKLLNYLPHNLIIEKSILYFHKHQILNYHYFVADKNILNLNKNTGAVLARYKDDKSYILLVQYPDRKKAKIAFESFVNTYIPDAKQESIIQIENGKWTIAKLKKKIVIIVFDANSKINSISKMNAVINKLR